MDKLVAPFLLSSSSPPLSPQLGLHFFSSVSSSLAVCYVVFGQRRLLLDRVSVTGLVLNLLDDGAWRIKCHLSFEDNAAQEQQLTIACQTTQSRNLVPDRPEILVLQHLISCICCASIMVNAFLKFA